MLDDEQNDQSKKAGGQVVQHDAPAAGQCFESANGPGLGDVEKAEERKRKQQWVGRTMDILVEGESDETPLLWEGRSQFHAPEIDGKVYINDFGPHETLVPGTFYRAEITEAHDYDVVAHVIE